MELKFEIRLADEPSENSPTPADHALRAADTIGSIMPDGSIYAGKSPETSRPMYAAPNDAPVTMTFNEAADYANKRNREKYLGHDDWRVPTKEELNVLFNAMRGMRDEEAIEARIRASHHSGIGGFDLSGSLPSGWYRSVTLESKWYAWSQRFSDGAQGISTKGCLSSVRLVR